ncbi:MAG: CAP domain-containing protein [Actinomadura sp.]
MLALAALAMSTGFAVDRLLPSRPETELVFEQRTPTPDAQSLGAPGAARAAASPRFTEPTPPLKRIDPPPPTPSPSPTPSTSRPTVATIAAAESAVVRLTNKLRADAGCGPLRVDTDLHDAAKEHSDDMAERGFFSHISPGGDTFVDRILAAGYEDPGAENIARGYQTAEEVMDGWMKSSGHRANILNCELRAIGVGAHFGSGGPWWTQDFGWD